MMELTDLPSLNASLNATSGVLLTAGYIFIRRQQKKAHAVCMIGAVSVSVLFLVSYLYYHAHAGSTKFPGTGWARPVYFTILISHSILASVVAFWLAPVTVWRAARKQFDRHKAIARWTLPVWWYVSVTGVVVYWMLYRVAW
jgi:uncharacterized membrane protein YozB (DUF420 family)